MLPRPDLFICPQRILRQSSVCTATDFFLRIRCEQMSGVIITAIHE